MVTPSLAAPSVDVAAIGAGGQIDHVAGTGIGAGQHRLQRDSGVTTVIAPASSACRSPAASALPSPRSAQAANGLPFGSSVSDRSSSPALLCAMPIAAGLARSALARSSMPFQVETNRCVSDVPARSSELVRPCQDQVRAVRGEFRRQRDIGIVGNAESGLGAGACRLPRCRRCIPPRRSPAPARRSSASGKLDGVSDCVGLLMYCCQATNSLPRGVGDGRRRRGILRVAEALAGGRVAQRRPGAAAVLFQVDLRRTAERRPASRQPQGPCHPLRLRTR